MTDTSVHVVLHTHNGWGHMKPLIGFAALLLEARPQITFTILTSSVLYNKCYQEITRIGAPTEHFRIIDFAGAPPPSEIALMTPMTNFEPTFRALWNSAPVTCRSSGKVWEGLPAPTTAILDPFTSWAFPAVRKIAGDACHIAAWLGGAASTVLHFLNQGDVRPALKARLESGMDVVTASCEVWVPPKGEIITVPGMPEMTMYDYESSPQEDDTPHALINQNVQPSITLADAVVIASIREIEEPGARALRDHLQTQGKTAWFVGPVSLPDAASASVTPSAQPEDPAVSFLDTMQAKHGSKSVVFVSFGTAFWPVDPDRLWAFLEELVAAGTPFVLAHASPAAVVPVVRRQALEASGLALFVPWAPQQAVLSHPATQAFVTHGGWNSVQETLAARIIPIVWPYGADQPMNAALLTLVHHAGFELLAVRTGPGASGIPYRCRDGDGPEYTVEGVRRETRELLRRLDSAEGHRVQENVRRLADVVDRAWGPDGAARQEMHGFLEKYID